MRVQAAHHRGALPAGAALVPSLECNPEQCVRCIVLQTLRCSLQCTADTALVSSLDCMCSLHLNRGNCQGKLCSRPVDFVLRPKRKVKGQTPKSRYLVEPKRKEKGQTPKSRIIRLVYVYL